MSVLIKNILLNGKETSIYIEENLISEIGAKTEVDHIIDGKKKAAIPGFVNTHTHSAMTLFRSYADDMPLFEWLQNRIWPTEAKLTDKDVYWGTKLACLEMIKTGTTCFNDMYWHMNGALKAVDETGIRAVLSEVFIDLSDNEKAEEGIRKSKRFVDEVRSMKNSRIIPAIGPHAIYTVSRESLEWVKEYSDREDLLVHFHLAETEKEIKDFVEKEGVKPVPYLNEIGFLSERLIAAHCNWLDNEDISILKKNNVNISHNPVSNMKLSSGVLPYSKMKKSGLAISLGTDGCSSNNNLDMLESMKFAALLQKLYGNDPTVMPAPEAFQLATLNGAKSLKINAGVIEEGKLADIVLIDLKRPELTPDHNLISNLVYSANGSSVDTVICDGKILMQNRKVGGEKEILEGAEKAALDLVNR